ncbi:MULTISPECIES: hypothetical protein [unclassified Pseudomonas]|uniref:hypothetical protein n=1 Tax=unclassified Pseudomonas TaxID=196821 RepID=UPI000A1D81F6|nr:MULTISPECIES: hypothetical protein [unclassified Pseudomonas]
MESITHGRVAWFSADKDFGCILCENHCCALLLGKDLLDHACTPVMGQRFRFRLEFKRNVLWAREAAPMLPLPDELSTGVPDDLGEAPGRRTHRHPG